MKEAKVTGGLGMIGSCIVRQLGAAHILDIRSDVPDERVDLRSRDDARNFLYNAGDVYACAAPTMGLGFSSTHHAEMFTDTVTIAVNTLHTAYIEGAARYLLISSACVYPDNNLRTWPKSPIQEAEADQGSPELANIGYGRAKRVAEAQAQFYKDKMHIVVIRPPNVFGPSYRWSNEHKHVIPALIWRMLANENPLIVWGNGRQTRQFIYEEDVARLCIAMLQEGVSGEAYNLGGHVISIAGVVEELVDILNYKGVVQFDDAQPTGSAGKTLSDDKLEYKIGEQLYTPFRKGLEKTVAAAQEYYAKRRRQGKG